jgi:tripartite-type tricarboxylate transporter receptor subunit TctC
MISRRHLVASAALAALPFAAARADTFPSRPVRIVVPFAAGGTGDLLCRTLQEPLQRFLGQPVIVENRLGASGSVGTQHVKNATPDGYTLLQVGNSTVTTALMQKAAGYDAIKDLAPVANVATTPMVFLLNPVIQANSIAELIAYAKPRPGELEYASAGRGSLGHLTNELFNQMAGLKMVYVPYQGSSQATNAVLAGEVKVVITTPSDAINAFVATGKLRMLGVSSPQRSPPPARGAGHCRDAAAVRGERVVRAGRARRHAARRDRAPERGGEQGGVGARHAGKAQAPGHDARAGHARRVADTIRNDQQIWIKVMQQAGLSPE